MVLSINELSVSKALGVLGLVIVTSCYIFPFEFKALPGFNTKMGIAALGLVCLFIELGKARDALINRQILNISVIALLVSLISLFSIKQHVRHLLCKVYCVYLGMARWGVRDCVFDTKATWRSFGHTSGKLLDSDLCDAMYFSHHD